MTLHYLILAIAAAAACQSQTPSAAGRDVHVIAANVFTQRYEHSRFAEWKIHARATGRDCRVLLIETSVIMEDSMVESLHYGAGDYGVVEGGVQRFSRDRTFRGVAYKDSSGRIWRYGDATDADSLKPCD